MYFLREQFVNEQIKYLLSEKSSNPAKSNSYKDFVPMIPFLIKKRYYENEAFLSPKFTFFPLILILDEKKSKHFFYDFRCTRSDHIFY